MEYTDIQDDMAEFSEIFKTKQFERLILACLKDLSQKTWAYTEEITFLTTAGTAEYTLTPTTGNQVFGLWEARRAVINTPQPSASTSATGGTLAAATYSYKVTAIKDDYGETLPCAAVTQATSGTTSTVTLTWTAIEGADGYRVYGRTNNSWLLMEEITTVTWTDDGSLTPSGAVPTTSELMGLIKVTNNITLNDKDHYWRTTESSANQVLYDGYSTARLNNIPTESGVGYQVKAAIYPTAVGTIPSVYEHYKDTIQDYVKWQAYDYPKTPKNPWADTQKAMIYRKQYARARANLKTLAMQGFSGELKAESQYFARGKQ